MSQLDNSWQPPQWWSLSLQSMVTFMLKSTQRSQITNACPLTKCDNLEWILTNAPSNYFIRSTKSKSNDQCTWCISDVCTLNNGTEWTHLKNILSKLTHLPWTNWPLFRRRYFRCIFLNENVQISIKISLRFLPKGPIDDIPVLVQVMAWHWPGDKPLSVPMIVEFNDAYMRHSASVSLHIWTPCDTLGVQINPNVLNCSKVTLKIWLLFLRVHILTSQHSKHFLYSWSFVLEMPVDSPNKRTEMRMVFCVFCVQY